MSELVCPACGRTGFDLCESVDVREQHKLYAPDDLQAQENLNSAAAETSLTYQMHRCRNCRLEFGQPLSAPNSTWYHYAYRALTLYPHSRWEFHEVIRHIQPNQTIFEFGCGSGSFLICCKEQGVAASGIDFSQDAVDHCRTLGLSAEQVDLNENPAGADAERFPHMVAFHVLEHLDRPSILFESAAARATPGAHFWISVPSDRRPTRYYKTRDFLDQPPHHMSRWTPEAFEEIGKRFGWRLAETLYEPISLRSAVWSISVFSTGYRRWKEAGRFQNPGLEKFYRAASMPTALLRRVTVDQRISGFSMLAHFVR